MPIYVGNQKVAPSGVTKMYVGSNLVYQEQTAGWHTIFEGTKEWPKWNGGKANWNDPVVETASEYKFRITFTSYATARNGGYGSSVYSVTYSPSQTLYNQSSSNSSTTQTATETDYEFDAFTSGTENNMIFIRCRELTVSDFNQAYLYFGFDVTNKKFYTDRSYANIGTSTNLKLTITKVEQYY